LGIAALAGGLSFYAISFLLFERDNKTNFRALSTFGLVLVLAGIFLPFPRAEFSILPCVCSLASCLVARLFALPTLGLHGAVYLLLGAAVSGATGQPWIALFAPRGGPTEWLASFGVLVAAAGCWTAIVGVSPNAPGHIRNQIASVILAAQSIWITAGLAICGVLALWRAGVGPGNAVPADTLGTAVLMALSLGLAWAGMHWRKRELLWVLYGLMALAAYKLATKDFVDEHHLALVVSLLCYGGALIILPQVLRARSPAKQGQSHAPTATTTATANGEKA